MGLMWRFYCLISLEIGTWPVGDYPLCSRGYQKWSNKLNRRRFDSVVTFTHEPRLHLNLGPSAFDIYNLRPCHSNCRTCITWWHNCSETCWLLYTWWSLYLEGKEFWPEILNIEKSTYFTTKARTAGWSIT